MFTLTATWCIGQTPCSFEHYLVGSKGQSSRSYHHGGGTQHSTLPSSATFSSLCLILYTWKCNLKCRRGGDPCGLSPEDDEELLMIMEQFEDLYIIMWCGRQIFVWRMEGSSGIDSKRWQLLWGMWNLLVQINPCRVFNVINIFGRTGVQMLGLCTA